MHIRTQKKLKTMQLFFSSLSLYSPMASSILLLLTLLSITQNSAAATGNGAGLSLELIRRDSPKSSFLSRRPSSNTFPETAQSTVTPENSQFLVKIAVGTPPRDVFAILDTGSDLFWTQCLPCANCYPQINPVFDPSRSLSFQELSCGELPCHLQGSGAVCSGGGACGYSYGYGGGLTEGNLATETVAVSSRCGERAWFENVVFGCGHNNSGGFNQNEMGLIGFGRGPVSFISQIGPSIGGRKFSLCLMPFNTDPKISGSIRLGSGSEVRGPGVVTIQLVPTPDPTFYSLTLTGISVGTTFLPYSSSEPAAPGNVILDSGTPPTLLPEDLYGRLATEVRRRIRWQPAGGGGLCYRNVRRFVAPPVTLHFDGGVELPLSTVQTFIRNKDGSHCFAVVGISGAGGIIGNFMMANFLVGYDIDEMTVSFKKADCTRIA